jgi:redox-sensitive bicupin YhaK (pirin superfamily)
MKTPNYQSYPANQRGFADHGWLKAKHTFSFASYCNPDRMNFGKIRVLNDDEIAPSMGFGEHAHDNMEIITIPLEGSLKHKDSTGNEGIIEPGEVQVMSAGHGIRHSEFNASTTTTTKLFQIWIQTAKRDAEPRYDQKRFWSNEQPHAKHLTLVSPEHEDSLSIHQDATLEILWLDPKENFSIPELSQSKGLFLMVVEGQINYKGQTLSRRDAIGITDSQSSEIVAEEDSQVLLIYTPM